MRKFYSVFFLIILAPTGVVTFKRRHINRSAIPRWDKLDTKLSECKVHISSTGTIEDDGLGLLQVDFANKYVNNIFL